MRSIHRMIGLSLPATDLIHPLLDTSTAIEGSPHQANWSAGCKVLSLQVLELDAGFWPEPPSSEHVLHVRLDRIGQVLKLRMEGRGSESMLPSATTFIPAGVSTGWRVAVGFRRLLIRFRPEFLMELAAASGTELPQRLMEAAPAHDPVLDHYAGLVLHEANSGNTPDSAYLDAFARLLGLHVLKRYVQVAAGQLIPSSGLNSALKERIDTWIRRRLPQPVVIEELAEAVGLSHYQLLRLIKRSTGDTPQQYVLGQRVELARKLLRESQLPLAEIALALGFSSQSHFSNTFKSFTQHTPKAYRERLDLL